MLEYLRSEIGIFSLFLVFSLCFFLCFVILKWMGISLSVLLNLREDKYGVIYYFNVILVLYRRNYFLFDMPQKKWLFYKLQTLYKRTRRMLLFTKQLRKSENLKCEAKTFKTLFEIHMKRNSVQR